MSFLVVVYCKWFVPKIAKNQQIMKSERLFDTYAHPGLLFYLRHLLLRSTSKQNWK
jgi:hypothetical protein